MIDKPLGELTVSEASELIEEFLQKVNGQTTKATSEARTGKKTDFGSGARLGMAFKCVYRKWASNGADIFRHKDNFIYTVLETYKLINEIAEKALETTA